VKATDFIEMYAQDSLVQIVNEQLKTLPEVLHLKGLIGSFDAVVASAIILKKKGTHLFVLHDKEEAYYFLNDLQSLLPQARAEMFPSSAKRAYQFEEVDNANILQRSEVLNWLNNPQSPQLKNTPLAFGAIIVAYPEALAEKVINKKSLTANTFMAKVGDKLGMDFLIDVLNEYDFERAEFVQEAGQYAMRGGILDIFSYAQDIPFRLEFLGDEIESIRSFEPTTQLSVDTLKFVTLIPNIHTKLIQEVRESFLQFLPAYTHIWTKDAGGIIEAIERSFERVERAFMQLVEASGGIQVIQEPATLYETKASFLQDLQRHTCIEFGKGFYFKNNKNTAIPLIEFQAGVQPTFNKDFGRLIDDLNQNQIKGYANFISADSFKQTERLESIFAELNPHTQFTSLSVALREGFIDHNLRITCYTDHQIFERYHRYRTKEKHSKSKALTIKELQSLQPGDFVTHIDYGIGRFAGLERIENNGNVQEAVRLVYRDDDLLYVNIHSLHKIAKYTGKDGTPPAMSKLGSATWENKKRAIKRQVQEIAKELIELYAKRKAVPGFPFSRDSYLQIELETSFMYEDTPDQASATADVKKDMEKASPMDRLVCGDVGFGKTEVAIRAAFKAVADSKQVAVLVPTTILAMQHFRTFSERLKDMPCKVAYINRFRSAQDIKQILKEVAEGRVDILIGTHKIVGSEVKFKNLGLMVIDEEQKFGVKTKDKLKEMRINVDVLTLTATPIPRTLQFSLMGARDLSIIATPPPNRQAVTTELHVFDEEVIRDAISYEVKRGGQVFFVHNRINDIESIAALILRLVPDIRIAAAHGQMDGNKLEKVMLKFIEGEYDVLVSTNIIESGLDIPNANTIIINMAQNFGLADLHQMRGRVGRSNKKAFCYLLAPAASMLSTDSRKRLHTLEEYSDLGDGFKVAMRDLDIRGAGNLLGAEQSGFVNDLGFETYHKILDEAIMELKQTEFKELFAQEIADRKLKTECNIETDLQIMIPENYIKNVTERLSLYSQLDNIADGQTLADFITSMKDRFGDLPTEALALIDTVRLRWLAEQIGFEKLILKGGVMKGYFLQKDTYFQSDNFGKVLRYVQKNARTTRLKEINQRQFITFADCGTIERAKEVLQGMV